MADENYTDVTQILAAAAGGDRAAIDQLYALLYPELRALAHQRIRSSPNSGFLDTTSLVHESYLTATAARFYQPSGIVRDAAGILYVADNAGTTIRRIALDGSVTTLAGAPIALGYADGTGAAVRFSGIKGLAIDAAGIIYAADIGNLAIRKITSAGVVSTLTGGPSSTGTVAEPVLRPWAIAVAADGTLYVTDNSSESVRTVSSTGTVTTIAGSAADNFTRTGSNPRLGSPTGIAILGPKSIAVAASRVYGTGVYASIYVLTLP